MWRAGWVRGGRVVVLAVVVVCGLLVGAAPGLAAGSGPRVWPVAGPPEVSRPFAPPEVRYAAGHRGVDLPAPLGAPVLAAAAGRVSYAGLLAGRGVVVVTHGQLRTTYEPVTAAVAVGDLVGAGSVLGQLQGGHLGCPVAACLHWGLKRGEDYLDPARWVRGGPVRLLPVEAGAGGVPAGGGRLVPAGGSPGAAGGGSPSVGRAVPAARAEPAAVRPAEPEPRWSLRSAEAPLGAAAVAALVAGIGLLARPRPLSPEPISGGAAIPVPLPVEEDSGPPGELVDLDAARLRRRSG